MKVNRVSKIGFLFDKIRKKHSQLCIFDKLNVKNDFFSVDFKIIYSKIDALTPYHPFFFEFSFLKNINKGI